MANTEADSAHDPGIAVAPSTLATDPVCGMTVDLAKSTQRHRYNAGPHRRHGGGGSGIARAHPARGG